MLFITDVSEVARWPIVACGIVKVICPELGALVVVANSLLLAVHIAAGAGDWNRSLRPIGDCGSLKKKSTG